MSSMKYYFGVGCLPALLLACTACEYRPTPMRERPPVQPSTTVEALRPIIKERTRVPIGRAFREWSVADTAADSLARIGDAATPSLIEGLADSNPLVRAQTARALARMGSRAHAATPALIIALDDEDVAVRMNAARALGQIGPEAQEAVPALMRALKNPANQAPVESNDVEVGAEILNK